MFVRYSLSAAIMQARSYSGGVNKEWYYSSYGYAVRNTFLFPSDDPEYFRLDQYENAKPDVSDSFPQEPSDLF